MRTKIYFVENLDCANCAAKIEAKIQALPGVEKAALSFATSKLHLTAEDPDALLPEIRKLASALEPDVEIVEKHRPHGEERHPHHHGESCGCDHGEHHHGENCSCGHEHSHEHSSASHAKGSSRQEEKKQKDKIELLQLCAGSVLFVLGIVLKRSALPVGSISASLLVFILAYITLGMEVLWTAGKNLFHGQVFDENFLMSIATLGAFAIGEFPEAVGVMLFYRIGEFFEHWAVARSRSQIMDAVDLRPELVNRLYGEEIETIPAEQAQVGDVLLVRPGDRIPLDSVVISGDSRIDTSPITGEPVPRHVVSGDKVISGCVNTSGQLKIQVEKPLEESMVTRILDSVENAAASKPKIDRFITRFSRIYTPVVVGLALFTALVLPLLLPSWHFFVDPSYTGAINVVHGNAGTASVFTALTFLVMSCPCALVLSVPLAFFSGIGAGSKRGILFKGGASIEALSDIKAVVMDKTGTITQGNFRLQGIVVEGGIDEQELLTLCAGCEQASTHPIAGSIVAAAQEQGISIEKPERLEEIPGCGIRALIDGREVLCGNGKLLQRFGIAVQKTAETGSGAEVLAAVDGKFAGCLLIADTLKPEAPEAIRKLRGQGLVTVMLTGDTQKSAAPVAEKAGIQEVHAQLLPQEKLERMEDIRSRWGRTMFVGDGINDAPVLAGADVGAAMGSGADAAIEAADVVFMTSSVEAIPESISIARKTRRIAWQNVVFALVIKALVMFLGLCGYASMWMAVFADSGVAMLCVLNAIRALRQDVGEKM